MNFEFIKKYKIVLLLGLIIFLSTFSRFYRLEDIYVFNFDEEYQATYAWTLVKDPHPIWIGVSASFLDFYLGPYFTYFTAILLAISSGDPLIGAYFAAFLGVATTVVLFFVGWKVFNLTTGVISSLLYAILPFFVFFDQKYWNTMFTPTVTLLLFLTMILVKKSPWWWVLFAGLFGSVLQTHLEPSPLLLIGVFYFIKGKYWKNIKLLTICLLVFAIFYWPLAVFDYYHNFSNWTIFSRFQTHLDESKIVFDPASKFRTLFDSSGRFWYLKAGNPNADEINFGCSALSVKQEFKIVDQYAKRTYAPPVLSLLTFFLLSIFLWKSFKEKKYQYKMLAIFLSVAVFFFMIFPGGSSEYYILYFLTLFTLVPGILVSKTKNSRLILIILILLAGVAGVNTVVQSSDEFSLAPKREIISRVMEIVGDKPFAIEGRGICHDYEGWRYLFKVYGRVPDISYTDKNLGWLYPEEIKDVRLQYLVILSEDRIPLKEDLSYLLSIKAGGYRAYIIKN